MKFGIVPFLDKNGGGIFQYSNTVLQALLEIKKKGYPDDLIILTQNIYDSNLDVYRKKGFSIESLEYLSFKKRIKQIVKNYSFDNYFSRLISLWNLFIHSHNKKYTSKIQYRYDLKKRMSELKIDVIFYLAPNSLSFEIGIPYIMPVHDLQHRLHPEFPEVSKEGEYEEREYLYRNGILHAILILADSNVGKEDILHFYNYNHQLNPQRIKVLPYIPSFEKKEIKKVNCKHIINKYHLPSRFLFYPAQFWPHKNHVRIVEALAQLKKNKKVDIPVVFCGSYLGSYKKQVYKKVNQIADRFEIDIRFVGFIPKEDLIGLFVQAEALIMPTFFGPTNIPILEAWMTDCPVITSDIRGIREQVGNAALLVNPSSVVDIANKIYLLWNGNNLKKKLILNGRKKITDFTFTNFCMKLVRILDEAKHLAVRS